MQSHSSVRSWSRIWRSVVCAAFVATLAVIAPSAAAAEGGITVAPGATLYFAATGQTTSGPFLAYWLEHQEIGKPVSTQVQSGLYLTQWFEYARLELRDATPDQATSAHIRPVELGKVYAEHIGYTVLLGAFTPKAAGPERFFPDTGHAIQNGFRVFYEQPGMPERLGPPISDEFTIRGINYQFFQFGAFRWDTTQGTQLVQLGRLDAWLNGKLAAPQPLPAGAVIADSKQMIALADTLAGERWLEVDLSDHLVTAWVGDVPVLREKVVTGSPNSPTVTGTFHIYIMNRIQDLSGIGWDGSPYAEAGVPWVMYFYEDYGFHGTTWRTSFGYSDSQGCVVMPNDLARLLWEFADYGTRVWIHN